MIADNCAIYVNEIFDHPEGQNAATLTLGAVLFAFQIYGDFSGYSDIALGSARLMGFNLLKNFNYPYFSRSISEFWRRWHISLSSWFKDYLYIPLGGSKGGLWMKIRNTFIIFLVSGFWHGANWTFIVWGGLNALFMMPSVISNTNRNNLDIVAKGKLLPTLRELFQMIITFGLTVLCWIFFRAESITHALSYIKSIFTNFSFQLPHNPPLPLLGIIVCFVVVEWLGREQNFAIEKIEQKTNKMFRYLCYYMILASMFIFKTQGETFIYFQF